MSAFISTASSSPRPLFRWLPPVGGLLAAAGVASLAYRVPLPHSLSLGEVIGSAIERVLGVLLANALTVSALCAILQRTRGADARLLILQTSLNALWLAPLVLFIRENSPWALAITAVLVSGIVKSVRLLQVPRLADGPANDQESPILFPSSKFTLLDSSTCLWRQVCGAGAALCAQTAAFAALAGCPLKAALLVGTSSAVWTWSFTADDSRRSSASPQSSSRALLLLSLAFVLTAGGLLQYLRPMYGIRGFGIPTFAGYAPPHGDRRGEEGHRTAPRVPWCLPPKVTPASSCGPTSKPTPGW